MAKAVASSFVVCDAEDRCRLDVFLAARISGVSRMRLRMALDQRQVLVNDAAQAPGWRLAAGDVVEVPAELANAATGMTPEPIPLEILFEDEHLVVVVKRAGMVVHPAGRHTSGTLVNALAHHFNVANAADPPIRPGIVHRLDRATSGLMVVAKTQQALSRLTVQFQRKEVSKRYTALVHRCVNEDAGQWSAPIGSDPEATPRWGIRGDGRPALSRFSVIERMPAHTLLGLEPVTGRTNQLRLHCAHFRHPIVGDALFGVVTDDLDRLFLHADHLEVRHPGSGHAMAFHSALPERLAAYLAALRGRRI
jgi:23S rRNA pseudouridine1911/1915/1917 synthase